MHRRQGTLTPMGSMSSKPREELADPRDVEAEWPERIREGAMAPFAAMFEAYHTRLCAYAEGYVRCPETSKEIVSDVFARIWEQRRQWVVTGRVSSYLYAAVRNRCMDHLRHARVRTTVHARAAASERSPGMGQPPPSPEEVLRARELGDIVRCVLNDLPPRAREAFLLQRRKNLSYAQIAAEMGISTGTVEKHMSRAIAALRARLAG
jgi:RNA polymerase sigma-70 factor (ECF subfamily)